MATTFDALKSAIQLFSCSTAIFLNALLFLLILTKSPPKMGTYRWLMCYFCGISIIFASLEMVVQPDIYSQGSVFLMVMDLRRREMDPVVGRLLVCILCGCGGVTMYGIAIHFVYRFFALERQGNLKYFKGPFLICWLLIPILAGINWSMICWHLLPMNSSSNSYMKPILEKAFDLPIESAAYSVAIFWPDGNFNWYSGAALINLLITMGAAFIVVIIMGGKSWMKIRELLEQGESTFARNLQMQLYKALVAQTLIPVLLLFLPLGILFICPLLQIDCGFVSTILTFIYAFYPALDPIPILYFVDNYRNAISEHICCHSNCKKSRITPSEAVADDDENI